MPRYKIVEAGSARELQDAVNDEMRRSDLLPTGGITILESRIKEPVYFQALVDRTPPKRPRGRMQVVPLGEINSLDIAAASRPGPVK